MICKPQSIRKSRGNTLSDTLLSFCQEHEKETILLFAYNNEMANLYKTILYQHEDHVKITTIHSFAASFFPDFEIKKYDDYTRLLNEFFNTAVSPDYDIYLIEEGLEKDDDRLTQYLSKQDSKLFCF